jgi:DNA-binding response OmpR family regulator|tara:strand:- start:518 stop:913 length:396 start_codon:yes stop_codon:yes gene_type:complete
MPVKYMSNDKKQSVLIIETDSAILKGLTDRFKKRGMLVITAKDGYEGYIRACNESPNFIILETLLPSMSGFRIARLLKFDERYKDITLIMVTTNDLDSLNEMFEACGADKILRKPFRFKELMEAMSPKVAA